MQNTFARESVLKNVLRFSLPYLLSYFLQTLYGMADLLIIGQFDGVAGTTAVSIGSQVMHMVTVMLVGLAMGITVGHRPRRRCGRKPPRGQHHRQRRSAVPGALGGAGGRCWRGWWDPSRPSCPPRPRPLRAPGRT